MKHVVVSFFFNFWKKRCRFISRIREKLISWLWYTCTVQLMIGMSQPMKLPCIYSEALLFKLGHDEVVFDSDLEQSLGLVMRPYRCGLMWSEPWNSALMVAYRTGGPANRCSRAPTISLYTFKTPDFTNRPYVCRSNCSRTTKFSMCVLSLTRRPGYRGLLQCSVIPSPFIAFYR